MDRVSDDRDAKLPVVGDRATLNDALDTMLVSSAGAALVTGKRDTFLGVIDVETVMDAIGRAHTHARSAHSSGRPVGVNTGTLQAVEDRDGTPHDDTTHDGGSARPTAGSGHRGSEEPPDSVVDPPPTHADGPGQR